MNIDRKVIKIFIPPIILSTIRNLKKYINKNTDREYILEGTKVLLPADHKLDIFQKTFPSYDKFITIIPKYIPNNSTVVDIGSNVGDSAIPFLKQNIKTICVEPSSYFLKYLRKNINDNSFSSLATIVDKLISTEVSKMNLVVKNGTASVIGKSGVNKFNEEIDNSITLDFLLQECSNVSFIKIDTDGFDFDVIKSGKLFFDNNKPLILFENLINAYNKKQYEEVYTFLEEKGYNNISVFDNEGRLIFRKGNWSQLIDFNNYIYENGANRNNIGYTDIFCYQDADKEIAENIINEFIAKFV